MPSALFKKLLLKPGHRAALLGAPAEYPPAGEELPAGVRLEDAAAVAQAGPRAFDFVQLFVRSAGELAAQAPLALAAVKPDGLLWIAYPKKMSKIKTDINRDAGWDVVHGAGWQGVALVSIDDTWSAMRFRPIR